MYIFQCKAPEILRKQTNNRFLERIVAVLPEKVNAILANFFAMFIISLGVFVIEKLAIFQI